MKALGRALSAETLKTKRTLAFWLALGFPLLLCAMIFFGTIEGPISAKTAATERWFSYSGRALQLWAWLTLSLFTTLEVALLAGLDHAQKQWKHLYSLPVPRWTVYTAKVAGGGLLTALSSVVLWAGILLSGMLYSALFPDKAFAGPMPFAWLAGTLGRVYLASLLVLAIQTWISLRWQSFALASGVGIAAAIAGVFIMQGADTRVWVHYYPWLLSMFAEQGEARAILVGAVGLVVAGAVGCWDVTRRDVL
jgi:lantibiotic transport system permease protein